MLDRRQFLRWTGTLAAGTWLGGSFLRTAGAGNATVVAGAGPYGDLLPPDANGIMLPPGFSSRLLADASLVVPGTSYTWHVLPDGGAVFPQDDGYVYTSNSEFPFPGSAGVGALRFDWDGNVVDAYPILTGTFMNCAGGASTNNTWLSCEENPNGQVWECDPTGVAAAVARPKMGVFQHEAVAFDPNSPATYYLTEDVPDGGFYRFTATAVGDLSDGTLEIAQVTDDGSGGPGGDVTWHAVPDPEGGSADPTRYQIAAATPFAGGEGIVYARGIFYFTTKGDHRVWAYDPATQKICVHYDAALDPGAQLTGVDNITASVSGDLFVGEDGGNMEIVLLSTEGTASPLLRIIGQDVSEICGPAFDPSQRRLYFSSQRGGSVNAGATYEITGPFRFGMGC